jgi:hypothetical protein
VGVALLPPSSSIFAAEDLAADRGMYIALAAFAVVAIQAASGLRCPAWAVALLALFLAGLSVAGTYTWASDERLWREAVTRAPRRSVPRFSSRATSLPMKLCDCSPTPAASRRTIPA